MLLISAFFCLVSIHKSSAHSPLTPGDNESLETAAVIPEPAKSWAIYGKLHEGGEAQYYRFDMIEGDRIYVMLFKSTNPEDEDFLPGFVLMGPGVTAQGVVPDYIEVPSGANSIVAEGTQPDQATYEPFSPSSFYSVAELDFNAPDSGTYYIAVYEPLMEGHYGLAVGYVESYTLSEWILIPVNLISVHQWEGQSILFILSPMIITLAIGIILMIWLRKTRATPKTPFDWLGSLAGLLFLGSGVILIVQMIFSLMQTQLTSEVLITLIFAVIPILVGIGTLVVSLKTKTTAILRTRVYLAILGIVALFMWAGLLIGPAIAIVASLLPSRWIARKP